MPANMQDINRLIELTGLLECGNYDCEGCSFEVRLDNELNPLSIDVCQALNIVYRATKAKEG